MNRKIESPESKLSKNVQCLIKVLKTDGLTNLQILVCEGVQQEIGERIAASSKTLFYPSKDFI